MVSIVFVCLGNICRSPAAEGIMKHLIAQRSLQGTIGCESAGVSGYHVGELADRRMRELASLRDINLTSRARLVTLKDFQTDYIVAMDRAVYAQLQGICPPADRRKVHLASEFSTLDIQDVPDPYYGELKDFTHVLDILEDVCSGLLKKILQECS